jgi:hypothetical protein
MTKKNILIAIIPFIFSMTMLKSSQDWVSSKDPKRVNPPSINFLRVDQNRRMRIDSHSPHRSRSPIRIYEKAIRVRKKTDKR